MIASVLGIPRRLNGDVWRDDLAFDRITNCMEEQGIDPKYDTTWEDFIGSRDADLRLKLIEYYRFITHKIAKRYAIRCMPYASLLDFHDLLSLADKGLMEAVDEFDLGYQVGFETFATHRIKGAIIDGLRSLQNFTRKVAQIKREIAPLAEKLSHILMRWPTLQEVADHYPYHPVGMAYLKNLVSDPLLEASVFNQLAKPNEGEESTDTAFENALLRNSSNSQPGPSERLDRMELIQKILQLLKNPDERFVVHCYFFGNMTSGQIAAMRNKSETWVSARKADAISKLRKEARNCRSFASLLNIRLPEPKGGQALVKVVVEALQDFHWKEKNAH